MTTVFMFPGQSSRRPDMLEELVSLRPRIAGPLIELASDVLGRDVRDHYRAPGDAPFSSNRHVQVGVFLASHLRLAVLEADGVEAERSLGLSLGEYNHLVHIGAISFEEALRLVDARGRAYDEGPSGAMAAVFPVEIDTLLGVVERARAHGVIEIGNFNTPTQHVLSGERAAIDAALALLEDEELVVGRLIETRVPMHCSRFAPVAEVLRAALEAARWKTPTRPYVPNVEAAPIERPSRERIVELLMRHVHQPVYFRQSIDGIVAEHSDVVLVEVGPGSVLHDLVRRSWARCPRFKTDTATDVDAVVRTLADGRTRRAS